jgi:hypothetical protein
MGNGLRVAVGYTVHWHEYSYKCWLACNAGVEQLQKRLGCLVFVPAVNYRWR